MSNYPSPYQPPNPYGQGGYPPGYAPQDPYTEALKPARRAGILMFILGGLFLICGTCTMIGAVTPSDPEATAEAMAILGKFFGDMPMPSPEQLPSPAQSLITGGIQFAAALTLLALAVPVRRGGRSPIRGAIVATTALALIFVASQLINAARIGGTPVVTGSACVLIPIMTPFLLLLVWLVQAMKAAPIAEQWSAYQRQYWQYMQSQAYGQGPYGPQPGAPAPPPGQAPIDSYTPPPPPPPSDRDVP